MTTTVLLSWAPVGQLASLDPFCLGVQAYLRFAQVDFAVNTSYDARSSPSGDLPVLCDHDEVIAGATQVINYLRAKGHNLDFSLSDQQKADVKAYCSLVEDQLHDVQMFAWWCDQTNYKKAVQPLFARVTPFPWRYFVPDQIQRQMVWRVNQHLGIRDTSPTAKAHQEEQVYITARRIFADLAAKLGDKPYFFGDNPTTLDAVVFGHLAVQYFFPLPNHKLHTAMSAFPVLIEFLNRIQRNYFNEWTPPITSAPPSPAKSPRKSGQVPSDGNPRKDVAAEERKPSALELEERRQRRYVIGAVGLAVIAHLIFVARNTSIVVQRQ